MVLGVRPKNAALAFSAMTAIDANEDGKVARLEWIKYSATVDPKSGRPSFGILAKQIWQQVRIILRGIPKSPCHFHS